MILRRWLCVAYDSLVLPLRMRQDDPLPAIIATAEGAPFVLPYGMIPVHQSGDCTCCRLRVGW